MLAHVFWQKALQFIACGPHPHTLEGKVPRRHRKTMADSVLYSGTCIVFASWCLVYKLLVYIYTVYTVYTVLYTYIIYLEITLILLDS